MQKPKLGGAIACFLLIGVLVPAVFMFVISYGMSVDDDYAENGIEVECRVFEVARAGKTQEARVSYKSESGDYIEARCIANQRVSVGQRLKGYVMPDDPYVVHCSADGSSKLLLYIITAAFFFGGLIPLIGAVKEKNLYDRLMKSGVPYKAQLASWRKEPEGIVGQFRVFTQKGEEKIVNIKAKQGTPIVGELYDILIAEGRGGRIAAALTDENLR